MGRWAAATAAFLVLGGVFALAEEEASATVEVDEEEAPAPPVTPEERGRQLVACKHAILKKWASDTEEIGLLVNETIDKSRPDPDAEPSLNYTEATRVLALRQLASCSRGVRPTDIEADRGGGLGDGAVERLLGGAAVDFNLTEDESDLYDKAFKGELVNDEAPAILGMQVHKLPLFMQIFYLVGVIALVSWVVLMVVKMLTGDKKAEKKEKKKQ